MGADLDRLRRPVVEDPQATLFDLPPDWRAEWWGMPSFEMGDARPAYRITVNFMTREDVAAFAARLGVKIVPGADSMWFPDFDLDRPNMWEYIDET